MVRNYIHNSFPVRPILVLVTAVFTVFLLYGCVIRQEISFNDDFSGEYKFSFDFSKYSEFKEKGKDSVEVEKANMETSMTDKISELEKIDGISNVNAVNNEGESLIGISYNFDGLNSLNESMKHSSTLDMKSKGENEPSAAFKKKGRKLYYKRPAIAMKKDSTFEMTKEFFRYEFAVVFKSEVKDIKVKSGNIYISDDNKIVLEKGNLFETAGKDAEWIVKFR